jgi:3-oxoacyl-[acyl-carrier protein] reductase
VINYTSPSSKGLAEQLAADLAAKHSIRTFPAQADLGTTTGPVGLIAAIKEHFAPGDASLQIDIIINNAGVAYNGLLHEVTPEDFDKSYKVNVLGPLLLMQAAEQYLPTDRSGRIINLSSVSSSAGFLGQSVYGGTKAALEAMTRVWARELSERCTVNAVNPGPVLTAMYASNTPQFKKMIKPFIEHTPLMRTRPGIDSEDLVQDEPISGGRPAYCHEIAGIVSMLCSDESAWCTGQVICANGGMFLGLQ